MKAELSYQPPKLNYLLYIFLLFFSIQSFAIIDCGNIEGFEFTNGHESVTISNGGTYSLEDLPKDFFINTHIDGKSGSLRYYVENLDTGDSFKVLENLLPYTFPSGGTACLLTDGRYKITTKLYKYALGLGECGIETIMFTIGECKAMAGTMSTDMSMLTLTDGMATVSATAGGDAYVPDGYSNIYVLTQGEGLVIVDAGGTPSFEVSEAGMYTIHSLVYNPETLDLSIVDFGTTTGITVNGLLIQGGGSICASLDVAGAKVTVDECKAMAGTMSTDMSMLTLTDGMATVSATAGGDAYVPDGYSNIYVLTQGEGLVIVDAGGTPSFEVSEAGMYTIHSLVYNPETLDLSIVDFGTTTGITVNGLLIQGGGSICASLDVAGAKVTVDECKAMAGTMSTDMSMLTLTDGMATVSATAGGDAYVPDGYSNIYVLTQGEGLVIVDAGGAPSFEVSEAGMYTIHSLVYNPETLDLSIVDFGTTTGITVNGLLIQGGGSICASLDVAGAKVTVDECKAMAGTMSTDMSMLTLTDGMATVSATAGGDAYVPDGYSNIYVLTQGEGLVIVDAGGAPSFEVSEAGMYTIHSLVYNPETLDLSIVDFGTTTGITVNGLLIQGGGSICASLDVAGAKVTVDECKAMAGTMSPDMSMLTLTGGMATVSATAGGDAYVPDGYSNIYVLTQGEGLVIVDAGGTPSFEVSEAGMYTIHSLVYNPETLDLSIVDFGTTTGITVNGLLIQGGGSICASLDVAGAKVTVDECKAMAGTMSTDMSMLTLTDGMATVSATAGGDAYVPDGYSNIYVLTQGEGLVIVDAGGTPSFEVSEAGMYTIHSLVYNPETLDLSIVDFGTTTGITVNGLLIQGGGSICASLDVAGAKVTVDECKAMAGTMSTDMSMLTLTDGMVTVSATAGGDAYVPDGYSNIYVLTQGEGLVIVDAGGAPSFEVSEAGMYTIHSLVYNPETLDLSIVDFGTTTGITVNGLLIQGGGSICASLDVAGAKVTVDECKAMAGTMSTDMSMLTLTDGMATVSATAGGDAYVPDGYSNIYVLTQGEGLVIVDAGGAPSFEVSEAGMYTIHSLVYNPETLDLSIVDFGTTTGITVNGLLIQGGGSICASLDVAGAKVTVDECKAMAGTMSTDMSMLTLTDGMATVSATAGGDAYVPDGYSNIYVLTQGEGLVIVDAGGTPSFEVSEAGMYTIHSLVYNPETLDLSIVDFGTTTGITVNGLLIQGGGSICASLDVAGAKVTVDESEECAAGSGTMYSKYPVNCLENGTALISAKINQNPNIPSGYNQLFVLTEAFSLTILNVSETPEFQIDHAGFYKIHSLVYDPNTLDLSVVVLGKTTGFDVAGLIADNGICASLDVKGATNLVIGSRWFCYFFNRLFKRSNNSGKSTTSKGSDNGVDLDAIVSQYDSYEDFKNAFISDNAETKFYPNPVVNELNVEMQVMDNEVMNYIVFDVSGRQVMSGVASNLDSGKESINLSRLNSGMYLIQFVSEFRSINKKITIRN